MTAEENLVLISETSSRHFNLIGVLTIISVILWRILLVKPNTTNRKWGKDSNRIKQLPGLPIVGAMSSFLKHRKDMCYLANKWLKLYGDCFQTTMFGKKVYCINDPALLKVFLESKDSGHYEKHWLWGKFIFMDWATKGLASMPVETWSVHRKVLSPVFAYANVKNYVQTFNIVVDFSTGASMDYYLGNAGGKEFRKNIETYKHYLEKRAAEPWLYVPLIWWLHPAGRLERRNFEQIKVNLRKIVQRHEPNDTSNSALDTMIKAGWPKEDIVAELGVLIFGGDDSVGNAVNCFFWMMAIDQKSQIACQQEIDQVLGSIFDEELTIDHVNNLKYLDRCIKETLRLFPGFTMGTIREVKAKLQLTEELTLEPGDTFSYTSYIVHRNPEYYPDPERFDPDRFLPENAKQRPAHAYLPFSAGARKCIGFKLAMVEISIVCATVLKRFHLYTKDTRDDIPIKFGISVGPKTPPKIEFRRRN